MGKKKKKSAYRNRSAPSQIFKNTSVRCPEKHTKLLTKIPFFMVWTWADQNQRMILNIFNALILAQPMVSIFWMDGRIEGQTGRWVERYIFYSLPLTFVSFSS